MPYLNLKTSAPLTNEKISALLPKLSKSLCDPTGKPEAFCMVSIDRAPFCMGDKECPAAFVDVRGIGGLSPEANKKISASVSALLKTELGLGADKIYLNFTDVAAADWGYKGGTFA